MERMASSLARPPALRITWASPSLSPAYFAGSSRASMHVRIPNRRAGGSARSPFDPNDAAYASLAAVTSLRTLMCPSPRARSKEADQTGPVLRVQPRRVKVAPTSAAAVAQQPSRRRPGALPVGERGLAVDDDLLVA